MDIKDLKLNDGKFLVKLARESVRTFFENSEPKIENVPNILNEKFGAFVTIKKNNELRGCIGYPFPIKPLYVAIIELAREAAFNDPRFLPLRKNELNEVIFEVSVLSKFELIKVKSAEEYIEKFNIGEGLYLSLIHI